MSRTIPDRGDLITLSFDPTKGHEQRGHRPGFVVSPRAFNRKTGLCFACPITNTHRPGNPFRVPVPAETGMTGYVMVDQLRSIDFRARHAKVQKAAPAEMTEEVLALLDAILFPE